MHCSLTGLLSCCLLLVAGFVQAQDLPTTNDLGIEVTPDALLDTIQETTDFWGPVRKHIEGEQFNMASSAERAAAVAFLTKVHDGLHERLFMGDEASAGDLLVYLGHRIRRYELYRQLRPIVADDARLAVLIEHWERVHRDINQVAAGQRAAHVEVVLAKWSGEMEALGLSAEVITRAMPLWQKHAECMDLLRATEAGQMMIAFEGQARHLDPAVAELLRNISLAADWVIVVRGEGEPMGTEQFIAAWDALAHIRNPIETAAQPTAVR